MILKLESDRATVNVGENTGERHTVDNPARCHSLWLRMASGRFRTVVQNDAPDSRMFLDLSHRLPPGRFMIIKALSPGEVKSQSLATLSLRCRCFSVFFQSSKWRAFGSQVVHDREAGLPSSVGNNHGSPRVLIRERDERS